MARNPSKKRCQATSRGSGEQCKNWATPGFDVCRFHGSRGGAPKKNNNAKKHGLFARYLPQETLDIVNEIDAIEPLDILYMNIKMQFASILRAQQIMYVKNKSDHDTFTVRSEESDFTESKTFEIHASWDKQATFMNSISRSMAELRSMIKQYIEMSSYEDDKLLEVERMKVSIDKLKAEAVRLSGEDGVEYEDDGFLEAIKGTVDVWDDENE